jgi:hypothetical protein
MYTCSMSQTSEQSSVSVHLLRVLIVFYCGCMKCSILYKTCGLELTVCAYYFWEMALDAGLDASFDNRAGMQYCGRQRKLILRKLV